MLLGPVFRAELLRTGRRSRYYVMRALYGALLLVLAWSGYEGTFHGANEATIRSMARFGLDTFMTFAIVQLATVLVLIPPLFAGAIADEKQRKTLHYLMASQLSGGEIILDKLLGRAANLSVFLLIGLPIASLLALFGGVAADYIVVAYVGTFSTATFAVALTMLVSTLARRVRQAMLIAYVALLAWLFVPTLVAAFGITLYSTSYPNIRFIIDWMKDSSPIGVWFSLRMGRWAGLSRMNIVWDRIGWMVGLQLGGAALLLLLSVLLLRPVFRRHESTPARRTWFKPAKPSDPRPHPWHARPSCGDDAPARKERYFAPADRFTKLALLLAVILVALPLAWDRIEWMVELQIGGAVLFLLMSVLLLRSRFRRHEGIPARRIWFKPAKSSDARQRRWHDRPSCGDDAVAWKERYFAPADLFTKLALLPAVIIVTLPLALLTEVEGRVGSGFLELWQRGVFRWPGLGEGFLWALRLDCGWYSAFWLLAVAGSAASSITIEREEDTWVSLTSTPLTGWQIIRGKLLGAIWNQRGFGAVLIGLWAFGLLSGAVHPLGVLLSIVVLALLTWLVAAIGVHASMRARSTSKALSSTIVALCVLNGYPIFLLLWFSGSLWWDSSFSLLGVLPRFVAAPLVSYGEFGRVWREGLYGLFALPSAPVLLGLTIFLFDVSVAALMTQRVVGRFDLWLDRPRIS